MQLANAPIEACVQTPDVRRSGLKCWHHTESPLSETISHKFALRKRSSVRWLRASSSSSLASSFSMYFNARSGRDLGPRDICSGLSDPKRCKRCPSLNVSAQRESCRCCRLRKDSYVLRNDNPPRLSPERLAVPNRSCERRLGTSESVDIGQPPLHSFDVDTA